MVGLAFAVIAFAFQSRAERERHSIDYLGAGLLAGGLSSVVLFTSLGGTTYAWGSIRDDRVGGARCGAATLFVLRRKPRRRADPADVAVQEPDLFGHGRDRVHHRPRAVRGGHLSAALLADRQRQERNGIRVAADADDGGRLDHLDRERQPDLADRPLQAVPDHGHSGCRPSDDPALASRRLDADLACGALPARARSWPRDGHAGPCSRGPERRPVPDARGCHLRLDAFPPDRRRDRRLDLRSDLRQPTCDGTRRTTTSRCPCSSGSEPGDRASSARGDPAAVHRSVHGRDYTDLPRRRRVRHSRLPAHLATTRSAAPRDRASGRDRTKLRLTARGPLGSRTRTDHQLDHERTDARGYLSTDRRGVPGRTHSGRGVAARSSRHRRHPGTHASLVPRPRKRSPA